MRCLALQILINVFDPSGFRKSNVWSPSTTKLDANCACKAPQWHLLGHCKETNHNWHKGSKLSNITGMPRWFFLLLHNRFYTWGRKKAWKMKPSNMGSKYRSLIHRLVLEYQKTTPFFFKYLVIFYVCRYNGKPKCFSKNQLLGTCWQANL